MQIRMSTRMMRWRRRRWKRTMTITMKTRKIQSFSCCLLIWNSNPHHHFQVTSFVPRDALDTRLLGEEQQFGHVQPGQQLWLQRERDLSEHNFGSLGTNVGFVSGDLSGTKLQSGQKRLQTRKLLWEFVHWNSHASWKLNEFWPKRKVNGLPKRQCWFDFGGVFHLCSTILPTEPSPPQRQEMMREHLDQPTFHHLCILHTCTYCMYWHYWSSLQGILIVDTKNLLIGLQKQKVG